MRCFCTRCFRQLRFLPASQQRCAEHIGDVICHKRCGRAMMQDALAGGPPGFKWAITYIGTTCSLSWPWRGIFVRESAPAGTKSDESYGKKTTMDGWDGWMDHEANRTEREKVLFLLSRNKDSQKDWRDVTEFPRPGASRHCLVLSIVWLCMIYDEYLPTYLPAYLFVHSCHFSRFLVLVIFLPLFSCLPRFVLPTYPLTRR